MAAGSQGKQFRSMYQLWEENPICPLGSLGVFFLFHLPSKLSKVKVKKKNSVKNLQITKYCLRSHLRNGKNEGALVSSFRADDKGASQWKKHPKGSWGACRDEELKMDVRITCWDRGRVVEKNTMPSLPPPLRKWVVLRIHKIVNYCKVSSQAGGWDSSCSVGTWASK